ncbi:GvpL/GvpF family gas vesicle protein [Bacillus sp. MM2020_1]|nr:GvpL/GvpF family gas vesicle protein [Bacillus sp. MM2020_1]
MRKESGVYVFCAIREKEPKKFDNVILNGQENEVYTIHYQNVAMVVSKVKGEVLPERNNLFAHQQTISRVMKEYSLIPMSFGNVFHSEQDVQIITKHMYDEFEKLFSHLENKIEVGLKVVVKQNWIDQEMLNDPVLSEWKAGKKDLSNPASFYDQIQLGELAQNFVLQLEDEVEKKIYNPLLELAEAGKLNNTIPGKILLNAAFLVDREKEEAFDQLVNDLFEIWKEKVEFKYSGPWPAYNFVNIRLRIEGKI